MVGERESLTKEQPARFQHYPALDGVRAIAIMTVMCYHLIWLIPYFEYYAGGGFLGVDIFFVLSGFLITSILLKEHGRTGAINLKHFFIRRFFRLAPAFWLFLVLLYIFGNYILAPGDANIIYSDNNFAYAFFYVMNIYKAATDGVTGNLNHTWSLAIEEQFYILWSLILLKAFTENRSRKTIAYGTAAFIVILVAVRALRTWIGTDVAVLYYSTESRIDSLLIGCLASMIFCWRLVPDSFFRSKFFGYLTLAAAIASVCIMSSFLWTSVSLYYGFISLFAAAIAVIILWLVTREKTPVHYVLASAPFRWIGFLSYSLYLWHYASFEFAKNTFDSVPERVGAGVVISFIAAAGSYYLVEKPFLRLKDRLGTKRQEQTVAATAG